MEELQRDLAEKLTLFMEENQQFHISREYTSDDGLTLQVLVDFGIEDRDDGMAYPADVFARFQDNMEYLHDQGILEEGDRIEDINNDELRDLIGNHELFTELRSDLIRAVRQVFDIPRSTKLGVPAQMSDVDIDGRVDIHYGIWNTRDGVESP
jgi:hypothetical protein